MKKCILVKSVTYAQKSQRLLRSAGIDSYTEKHSSNPNYGCAWCVAVSNKNLDRALSILKSGGVKMTGDIYDIQPNRLP